MTITRPSWLGRPARRKTTRTKRTVLSWCMVRALVRAACEKRALTWDCHKTVARQDWVKARVAKLKDSGLPFKYFQEREPLRFGGGPKIFSSRALVFPLCVPGCKLPVMLRTSIVEQDVPILISRGALQSMGMIMNLVDCWRAPFKVSDGLATEREVFASLSVVVCSLQPHVLNTRTQNNTQGIGL